MRQLSPIIWAMSSQLKEELRANILKKRDQLSLSVIRRKSKLITQKLLALDEIGKKNNFSAYLAIRNEVETYEIINKFKSLGKNIFLPCYLPKRGGYFFARFANFGKLEKGPYNILQPKNPRATGQASIEVAIIPAVAFSKNGFRLGYGKGVFDRLLGSSNAFKIGLAYDFQIVESEDWVQAHDLQMDLIVTEKGLIHP